MLTKMPKVGDVLIANDIGVKRYSDVTVGEEYTVFNVSIENAIFLDDMRDECYISEDRLECFTLKSEANNAEPVGFIKLIEVSAYELGQLTREIVIYTDDVGLKTIQALAEQSDTQRKRTEIQSQIDALQAELDAL